MRVLLTSPHARFRWTSASPASHLERTSCARGHGQRLKTLLVVTARGTGSEAAYWRPEQRCGPTFSLPDRSSSAQKVTGAGAEKPPPQTLARGVIPPSPRGEAALRQRPAMSSRLLSPQAANLTCCRIHRGLTAAPDVPYTYGSFPRFPCAPLNTPLVPVS